MKLTKQYLKNLIQEIFRINKDGEKEEFGPPEEIDQIYHDSTRDDEGGYTKLKKPLTIRISKKKEDGEETQTFEVK